MDWENFHYLNAIDTIEPPSGYQKGLISPPNVIYNGSGRPASIVGVVPFDLLSAYVTAAWRDNLALYAAGSLAGKTNFTLTTNLSTTTPLLLQFGFFGVDRVDFTTSGGTNSDQFVMDNVLIVPHWSAPTPPTLDTWIWSEGWVGLRWGAQLGQTYQIESAAELPPQHWMRLGPPITATSALISRITTSTNNQGKFYRLNLFP